MGIWPLNSAGDKIYSAKVSTMEADLDKIPVEPEWKGRQLFDTVCRITGLREIWYFGLQFTNKKGIPCWLQLEKKITKQDVVKSEDGTMNFLFLVKFYPEDIEEELIQDLTRHLFFLQLKEAILSGALLCSAEASVLLASFALQAMYGDCNEQMDLNLEKLIPRSVINQYHMTPEMWGARIRRWWSTNSSLMREEAELEYLRVTQDLDMYGIQYYPIRNKRETNLHLGIAAHGIGVYQGDNRVEPRPFFPWDDIKNIHFKKKKFFVRTMDKSDICFQAQDASINMSVLDLCIGTHNLYLRRRKPDLLEVQQMKGQSKEERARRKEEQKRLEKERRWREEAEEERDLLRQQLAQQHSLLCSAETKAKESEDRLRLLLMRTNMLNKQLSESQTRLEDAEQRLAVGKHHNAPEWKRMCASSGVLVDTHNVHGMAGETGEDDVMRSISCSHTLPAPFSFHSDSHSPCTHSVLSPALRNVIPPDPVAHLAQQPDALHLLYMRRESERALIMSEKLAEFRMEMEELKKDDFPCTENDKIVAEHASSGFDRITNLRMSSKGTIQSRVQQVDDM